MTCLSLPRLQPPTLDPYNQAQSDGVVADCVAHSEFHTGVMDNLQFRSLGMQMTEDGGVNDNNSPTYIDPT
jgi:hypothetical protein